MLVDTYFKKAGPKDGESTNQQYKYARAQDSATSGDGSKYTLGDISSKSSNSNIFNQW